LIYLKLPKKTIPAKRVKSSSELEIVPVYLSRVMINPNVGGIAVLTADDKEVALPLSSSEGTMISFVHRGLAENSHIHTLPQMYIRLLQDIGTAIESVTLESKVGDVIYASIKLVDRKHRRFWSICSYADGLILAILSKSSLRVVKALWDTLEDFNDWPYENHMISFDQDDEDFEGYDED
jgi:hypothetical protein